MTELRNPPLWAQLLVGSGLFNLVVSDGEAWDLAIVGLGLNVKDSANLVVASGIVELGLGLLGLFSATARTALVTALAQYSFALVLSIWSPWLRAAAWGTFGGLYWYFPVCSVFISLAFPSVLHFRPKVPFGSRRSEK